MKFSIIMTTWNRASILPKTINSILNQTYPDFELLIMDDGSTDNTQEVLQKYAEQDTRIRLFKHDIPQERVISRKFLMEQAIGDWIYWVDSDDEIIYGTLEILAHNINANPEYKVFNFGQTIFSLTGTTFKLGNDLPDHPEGEGMYHFDTGRVGTGGFTVARECLDSCEPFPEVNNVFHLAEWFGPRVDEWFAKYSPGEKRQLYGTDDEKDAEGNITRECKWCGNPWGDDYVFMWLVTRKFKSKKLPINPYVAYIRTENWAYEFSDGSGVMGGSTKGV